MSRGGRREAELLRLDGVAEAFPCQRIAGPQTDAAAVVEDEPDAVRPTPHLLMALTIALCWLALFALSEPHALPDGFQTVQRWSAAVWTWGRPSFLSRALALVALDLLHDRPPPWLQPNTR